MPKKKKNNGKKEQKAIHNKPKKKKGEKSPNDCAKLFVQSVSSPQEGYAIAIQYLLWGGVGGDPLGRGILIPGSEVAFPATPQGISKCWQRYSPLIHVMCRNWPGFSACLVTHLIDFVLSIQESDLHRNENENNECDKQRHEPDAGSTRKLFFLSGWVRLLLSQRFVAALDRNLLVKNVSNKMNNPLESPLAQLNHLESLGYPLNSLLDRCLRFSEHHESANGGDGSNRSRNKLLAYSDSTKTGRAIIQCLETILGGKQTSNFGCPDTTVSMQGVRHTIELGFSRRKTGKKKEAIPNAEVKTPPGAMSLDEMEAMLLYNDGVHHNEEETKTTPITDGASENLKPPIFGPSNEASTREAEPPKRRSAWVRCERWDACAIGTMPGYPC